MTKSVAAIASSDLGLNITFGSREDYDAYNAEHQALVDKYRKITEEKFGYWAGNQNKFVKTIEEMNQWDKDSYYRIKNGNRSGN